VIHYISSLLPHQTHYMNTTWPGSIDLKLVPRRKSLFKLHSSYAASAEFMTAFHYSWQHPNGMHLITW